MKFVKGKTGINLVEQYEDFLEFAGESDAIAIKKVMSKEQRSTSGGKGTSTGGNYGLSDSQKHDCDTWNLKNPRMKMNYKEYADRMAQNS